MAAYAALSVQLARLKVAERRRTPDGAFDSSGPCMGSFSLLLRIAGGRHDPFQPHIDHEVAVVFQVVRSVEPERAELVSLLSKSFDRLVGAGIGKSVVGSIAVGEGIVQRGTQLRLRRLGFLDSRRRAALPENGGTKQVVGVGDVAENLPKGL